MLSRTACGIVPSCTQVRGMATLKDISKRLKAVTTIQKVTKSMKVVSSSKFAKAEKELKPTRAYGEGATAFYEKIEAQAQPEKPKHLIIAMSSDKGLCGAIHSSIGRAIRQAIPEKPAGTDIKIICVGDKQRAALARFHSDKILMHFADVGKKPPTFADAGLIANAIMKSEFEFDNCELYYNVFKTVVSYTTTIMPIYTNDQVNGTEKFNRYDSIDEEVLKSYSEFALVSQIYYALKEGLISELSARMTAMEGASKNAGEVIDKLNLAYNRKRQAVITTELIEIISGAAALE